MSHKRSNGSGAGKEVETVFQAGWCSRQDGTPAEAWRYVSAVTHTPSPHVPGVGLPKPPALCSLCWRLSLTVRCFYPTQFVPWVCKVSVSILEDLQLYPSICSSIQPSVYPSMYRSMYPPCMTTCLCVCLSTHPPSIHLFVHSSMHPSSHLCSQAASRSFLQQVLIEC